MDEKQLFHQLPEECWSDGWKAAAGKGEQPEEIRVRSISPSLVLWPYLTCLAAITQPNHISPSVCFGFVTKHFNGGTSLYQQLPLRDGFLVLLKQKNKLSISYP